MIRQLDASEGSGRLTKADVYGANIGDAGALRLASSLNRNYTLRILNVGSNCIGDEGGAAIAKALQINTILQTLHLHENSIGNDAVFCFRSSLGLFNATLRVLDLSSNAITDTGAVALSNIFKSQSNPNGNSSLTELYLRNNPIGNAGSLELSKSLHTNSSLMLLDMSHCRITDAGGSSFVQALIVNTHLQTLNLSCNAFSQSLGDQFLSLLRRKSELVKLFLECQGISHDTASQIRALGPQPPPPPTKWVRPAAQGVMEALTSQMAIEKLASVKKKITMAGAVTKSGRDDECDKSVPVFKGEEMPTKLNTSDAKGLVLPSRCKTVSKKTKKSMKGDVKTHSVCMKHESIDCNQQSIISHKTGTTRIKELSDPKNSEFVEVAAKKNKVSLKAKLQSISALKRSGIEHHNLKSSAVDSKDEAITDVGIISKLDETDNLESPHSECILQSAKIQASLMVSDAHAIATDIIMTAQKQLARVLVVSKEKPLRFEDAEHLSASLNASKTRLTHSHQSHSLHAESITDSTHLHTQTKIRVADTAQIVESSIDKPSSKYFSAPLGFQRCQLVHGPVDVLPQDPVDIPTVPAPIITEDHEFATSPQNIESEDSEIVINSDTALLPDSQDASPYELSEEHFERLRSFMMPSDAAFSDPLICKPIEFIPLSTLPYFEMEHLSHLFLTEDATSILQSEITGPMWSIKIRPIAKLELEALPDYIVVKQFFEELNPSVQQEFLFLNAIQGQYCLAITHVLGREGVPVGLLLEHLPLILEDAMQSFSLLDAIEVLLKCAAAVHSLHLSNVVHSNINTSSFLLSSNYQYVKLVEFAIDQCILSSIGFVLKQEPFFVAPEMWNGDNIPTVSTDIYAFGALIWRVIHPLSMLPTGNAPIAVSLAAARGTLPIFTTAGVPSSISDICHRCMSVNPNTRPQSIIDIIDILSSVRNTISSRICE